MIAFLNPLSALSKCITTRKVKKTQEKIEKNPIKLRSTKINPFKKSKLRER